MVAFRRVLGPTFAIAVILTLGSGIYLRIRGSGNPDEPTGGSSPSDSSRPQVSATSTFRTDVAIPVVGAEVVRDTLVLSVSASGQAAAWREAKVLARTSGQIETLPVRESQIVSRGRLLVGLDTADLALEVEDARARLTQAQADFRERTVLDEQIEDEEIREERRAAARAKSGIDQAEINLRQRLLQLERSRIPAPFTGRVADIMVVPGQFVRENDELMTVLDLHPIKVEVQVLESEIGYLAPGRQARVSFAAFPDTTFVGEIATINPLVDSELRTVRVTVQIPNPRNLILPGMYARVSLEARRFPNRVLVPRSAVLERDRREMVFVYQSESGSGGLAKWHYVTTGLANDSLIEIVPSSETDLVEPGQIVLVDGHYTLIHDARVRLTGDLRAAGGRPQ